MLNSSPRIVVLGPAGVGKKTLVTGIFKVLDQMRSGATDPTLIDPTLVPLGEKHVSRYSLALSTKYYDAELNVLVLPAAEFEEPTECTTAALVGAEAVILLLDAVNHESFVSAARWPALLEASSPSCMLCVVNRCDAAGAGIPGTDADECDTDSSGRGYGQGYGSISAVEGGEDEAGRTAHASRAAAAAAVPREHRAYLSRVQEWCLDTGFETVECAASQPMVGSKAREKAGVARVVEALQSNMWSNMRRKQPAGRGLLSQSLLAEYGQGGGGGGAYAAPQSGTDTRGKGEEGADKESSLQVELEAMRLQAETAHGNVFPEAQGLPSGNGGNGSGAGLIGSVGGSSGTVDVEPQSAAAAESPVVLNSVLPDSLRDLEESTDFEGDEGEGGGPDLGMLMQQMRSVRDAAMQGGLSDEQRREAAARMAMRLFELLGEEGDPSD